MVAVIITLVVAFYVVPIASCLIIRLIWNVEDMADVGGVGDPIPMNKDPWYKDPYDEVIPPGPGYQAPEFDHTIETLVGHELIEKLWN